MSSMSKIQYLRLFSISTALTVGFWLPLRMNDFNVETSVELFLDSLISVAAAVNLYLYFKVHETDPRNWRNWLSINVLLDFICLMPLLLIEDWLFQSREVPLVLLNLFMARHIWKIKDFLDEFDNLKPIVYRLVPIGMMMPLLVHLIAWAGLLWGVVRLVLILTKYSNM